MARVNWNLPAACALGLLVTGTAYAQSGTAPLGDGSGAEPRVVPMPGVTPRVIVRVGGDAIYVPDLLQFAVSSNQLAKMSEQQGRTDLLYVLIVTALLRQAALAEGLLSEDAPQNEMRQASLELQRRHFPPPPLASTEEAKAHFEKNIDRYGVPEHVRVRQILIASPPDTSEADREAAAARIKNVVERLRSGEDFAKVAADTTDNPNAKATGGDLGFVPLLKGTEFADVVGPLEKGQNTAVLKSERGYEIFQLIDRRPPIHPSFEEVRAGIQKQLAQEEFQRRRTEYITALAKKTDIVFEMPDYQGAHPLNRKDRELDIFGM